MPSFGPCVITTGRFAARAKGIVSSVAAELSASDMVPLFDACAPPLPRTGSGASAATRVSEAGRAGGAGASAKATAISPDRTGRGGGSGAGVERVHRLPASRLPVAAGFRSGSAAAAFLPRKLTAESKSATSVRFAPAGFCSLRGEVLSGAEAVAAGVPRPVEAAGFAGAGSAGGDGAAPAPPGTERLRPRHAGFFLFASFFVVFAEQPSKQATPRWLRLRHIGHHAAARSDVGTGFLMAGKH